MVSTIPVTKVDAAERQLRESIRLFFEERDPLAIHTLACAASQVTADLLKAKGLPSIVRSGAMIRAERRAEVLLAIRAPENFLKHANSDPEAVLDFPPAATPYFIFAALAEFQTLTGRLPLGAQAFMTWFYLKYPDVIADGPATENLRQAIQLARATGLSSDDKAAFLEVLDEW